MRQAATPSALWLGPRTRLTNVTLPTARLAEAGRVGPCAMSGRGLDSTARSRTSCPTPGMRCS